MSPLIAEVSRTSPSVARSCHADYIAPGQVLLIELVDQGVAAGELSGVDRRLFLHLAIGPIVALSLSLSLPLSLSRELFATFPDLDARFPVPELREGQIGAGMDQLVSGKPRREAVGPARL